MSRQLCCWNLICTRFCRFNQLNLLIVIYQRDGTDCTEGLENSGFVSIEYISCVYNLNYRNFIKFGLYSLFVSQKKYNFVLEYINRSLRFLL